MNENKAILLQKLDEFVRKFYKNQLIKGVIYSFAIVCMFFLSLVLLEYFGNFNVALRTTLFFGFVFITIATLIKFIFVPLLQLYKLGKFIDYNTAASIIGKHFGEVQDKLINTLQLMKEGENSQNELLEFSINQKIESLKPVPFSNAIDFSGNKKYLKYAIAPVLLFFFILFVNARILKDGTKRIVQYNQEFVPEAPFQFNVLNESFNVIENEDFDLKLALTGREIPNEVFLVMGKNSIKLRKTSKTEFEYTFKNVQGKKEFLLTASGYNSQKYELTSLIKPIVMGYEIDLIYPKYTHLSNTSYDNLNEVVVPEGTRIRWKFKTKNTSRIFFKEQGKLLPLTEPLKGIYEANKSIVNSTSFTLNVQNEFMTNLDSLRFRVSVNKDQFPSISAREKMDSASPEIVYFQGEVKDDYGFTKLSFNFRKYNKDSSEIKSKFTSLPIDFATEFTQSPFYHIMNKREFNLQLNEVVEYYFEVWDNDAIHGAKSSRTATQKIEMPSEKEFNEKQEQQSNEIKDGLEKNIKKSLEVQQAIRQLSESLMNKKNADWQDKKRMKELIQQQKELSNQNKQLLRETQNKNEEKNQIEKTSDRSKEKQEKLEKLMEELKSEEMEKLYKKLEEMMEKLDKKKLQQSLEKMDLENTDLQKEMERTLEIFKQMEMDDKLEEFAEKMEKLAEKQEKLANKEEKTNEEQEKLKKEFEKAEEQLKEIKEKNDELENKKDLNELEQEKEEIKEDMNESSKSIEKNKQDKANESQQDASDKMKAAAAKAKDQMSSSSSSSEENMEDLRALLENLLTLSFDQESVLSEIKQTNINDPKYVVLGQQQVKLKGDAKMIEDSLFALSKRIEQIQPIVNKEMNQINVGINNSLAYIGERKTRNAAQQQQFTMTALNNLALLLDEAMKELQKQAAADKKPGGGTCNNPGGTNPKPGLLPGLKEAQGQAGEALKKLKKQGEKGKSEGQGKNGNSKELAKMAAEQAMLRKAIQELSQELNGDGSGLGNELKKIDKELEKIEEDIVNDNVNQETINRQKEILTRLLKSEKALMERELDEKRESQGVKNPLISNPDEFFEYKKQKQKELEQLKTIPGSLLPYYKNRVNDYFNQAK